MLWSTLRDNYIRIELKDALDKKWSDADLLSWAATGMRDISGHMPRRKSATITTVSETKGYSLITACPDRAGSILSVEHPDGVYLEEMRRKPGTGSVGSEASGGWYELDDYLYLTEDPDTSYSITVWYQGQRDIPTADDSVLDLYDNDSELLLAFVCWRAFLRVGGADANLSRWAEKGGRRDDNPLKPTWVTWKNRYDELVADRTKPTWMRLWRRGRMP